MRARFASTTRASDGIGRAKPCTDAGGSLALGRAKPCRGHGGAWHSQPPSRPARHGAFRLAACPSRLPLAAHPPPHPILDRRGGSISFPNICKKMPGFMVSHQEFRSEFYIQGRAVDVFRGFQENTSRAAVAPKRSLGTATAYEEHCHNVPQHPLRSFQ